MKNIRFDLRAAALAVFAAAVAAGPALGQAAIRLACIGNSITQGTVQGVKPYAVRLQTLLGSGYKVQNDGVSGCTLLKQGDKPYWTKGKLDSVFAFKPNIVTIKLGTNDSKDVNWPHKGDFVKDYEALIDTLGKLSTKPKIYVCLPVPAWPVNGVDMYTIHGPVVENEVIPRIDSAAKARGLTVIDLHNPMKDMQAHFADGVHPDQVGQDKIADLLYAALKPTAVSGAPSPPGFTFTRTGDALRVTLSGGSSARAEVSALDGRALRSLRLGPGGGDIPLGALAPGRYLLTVRPPGARASTRAFDLSASVTSK